MLLEKLVKLRNEKHLRQEEIAQKLNVSRQAVQKWENGTSMPTIDNLILLSDLYQVTLDYLCRDTDYILNTNERIGEELLPRYDKLREWELWSKSLNVEYLQCVDEGKDIEQYKSLFDSIAQLPPTDDKEKLCDALFSIISKVPSKESYPYYEPDDLSLICDERREYSLDMKITDLSDRMLGGWYGRICGCFLGKPVECIRSYELESVLRQSGNYPLSRYIEAEDITDAIAESVSYPIKNGVYSTQYREMPSDDDTNYMIIALEVLKHFGRDFTSENVANIWLTRQPKTAYCTAEQVAFINFVKGYQPPESAKYKNSYREWIGAQIRGDVFGYVNPCNPEKAAEMAWRDARISHIKNGIYGEMWVSAMIAAAYGSEDILGIIRRGLATIPAKSRLYENIEKICKGYESGVTKDECFADIASRWDEKISHHWCHTISNAEIVAASLLYGGGDYGKSICMAVSQGFDTDCNGATVGSVLGIMLGYKRLPKVWTDRINDTLNSTIVGYTRVSVKKMAEETLQFAEN